jgi:lipoate-protein ligase A
MQRLDLTLSTPAENVALDEALLDWAEEENHEWECLRLWESPVPIVVVGRSTRVKLEIQELACRQRGIPILRRSSGGAAIVAGPGCLMYAVVLSYRLRPELKDIRRAHAYVLNRLATSLTVYGVPVAHAGTSDLVIEQGAGSTEQGVKNKQLGSQVPTPCSPLPALRKFSGNSLRAKRSHLLYHGTLLYNFELGLIETCLRMPPRVPDYREGRSHRDFVTNLPITRQSLIDAVDAAWPTQGALSIWPIERVSDLVAARLARDSWNLEFG